MAITTAMKMLHVRTLMEALFALVMSVIKDPAPHVQKSMNVSMAKMIVIAMLLVQILLEATNVNVILDTMVMVLHALILTNAQQMIITAM